MMIETDGGGRREQCRRIARLVEAAAVGVAFTLKITPLTVLTWWLTTTAWQEVWCAGERRETGEQAAPTQLQAEPMRLR